MAEILLVNPRRRRKAKSAKRRARRAAPRRARKVARRRSVTVKVNPRKRYARKARAVRRRRRNPSFRGVTGQIVPTMKSGFVGALGGLGLDVLTGFALPRLPAAAQSGYGKTAVKVLGAVLVGMLGNMVARGRGRDLATGAMTIVIHEALKDQVASSFPAIPLGEYFSAAPAVGYDGSIAQPLNTGIGEYFSPLAGDSYGEDDALNFGAGY
jgi:uncharacterized protein YcfJ